MWKFLVITIGCAAVFFIAGVTGILFYAWPTFLDRSNIRFTPKMVAELKSLREQSKFHEDRTIPYPGAPNEMVRMRGQMAVDALIDNLLNAENASITRAMVLKNMKSTLSSYNDQDSEERDRILIYLEQMLGIIKIDGSAQLFNVWRYGLPHF